MAVVCHGIEIASAAGVLRGRTCTTVAKSRWTPSKGALTTSNRATVRDGNLITARTWHDYGPFLRAFMQMLMEARRGGRA